MVKLNILWTTDNKDTFFHMVSMFAINSIQKDWWKKVNVIIWGASAKLTGNDSQVQSEIIEMINAGVTVEACKDCADNFGVSDKLEKLGVTIRYMGLPLTEYLNNSEKVISI